MAMKDKKKKIQQNNRKDFNLLYETLLSGGTYGEYKQQLQDRSMPQEKPQEITEDDILQAWILGKDEESEQFASGGHVHQSYNSYLTRRDIEDSVLNNPMFQQTSYVPDTSISGDLGFENTGLLGNIKPQGNPDIADNWSGWQAKGQYDPSKGAWEGAGNSAMSGLAIAGTLADWGAGMYDNTVNRVNNASNKIEAGINRIGSQNFGIGDTAYMASQYDNIQRAQNTSIEDNGGMTRQEGLLNGLKSIGEGSATGAQVGGLWGGIIGGVAGLGKGIGEWFLNRDAAGRSMALNNLRTGIANSQVDQKYGLTNSNANKLYNFSQLQQPYMAACGGKMKNRLASGGYINSHYDYITDPLVKVNAGGLHQENPNEGVQTSIAPDGQPNLVEEGETIINNGQEDAYVFSDRIVADEEILKSHLLPVKFKGKTYADISKELDKIIEEHKGNEIEERTFQEMIKRLQEAQEDQKYQEKAEEVAKFIDGLSDEQKEQLEQTMVEEAQAEQEQAMADQQAVQGQAAQEQAVQEQQMQPEQSPEQVVEQPQEQAVPSRYDQMMSRAAITDAANGGMFGRGGHLHQNGQAIDNTYYSRGLIDPLMKEVINKRIQDEMQASFDAGIPYVRMDTSDDNNLWSGDRNNGTIFFPNGNAETFGTITGVAPSPATKTKIVAGAEKGKQIANTVRQAKQLAIARNAASTQRLANSASGVGRSTESALKVSRQAEEALQQAKLEGQILNNTKAMNSAFSAQPKPTYYTGRGTEWVPRSVEGNSGMLGSTGVAGAAIGAGTLGISVPVGMYAAYNDENGNAVLDKDAINGMRSGRFGAAKKSVNDASGFPTTPTGQYYYESNPVPDATGFPTTPTGQYYYGESDSDTDTVIPMYNGPAVYGTNGNPSQTIPTTTRKAIVPSTGAPLMTTPVGSVNATSYNPTVYNIWNDPLNDVVEEDTDRLVEGISSKNNNQGDPAKGNPENPETNHGFNWLRYAPAIGSGLQHLSDLLGITNRPDYTNANMYQRSIDNIPTINYLPIGSYINYSPIDETYQQNQLRAANNAARRAAIVNSGGNAGAALAALNAIGYNESNALGDLGIRVADYNNQMGQKVAEHNLRINQINASNSLSAQEKNQAIAAEKARLNYNLAQMRQSIEDQNDMVKAANYNNLMTNLGNIGRENFIMNQINDNPAYYYSTDRAGHITYKQAFYDQPQWVQDLIRQRAEQEGETKQNKKGE